MSQQIPASTPSPVSPAAAPQASPQVAQGSQATYYPQWNATQAAPSVAMPQQPYPGTPASAPSISNQSNQSPSSYSPSNPWEAAMSSLERVVSQISPSPSQTQQYPSFQTATDTVLNNPALQARPTQYPAAQVPQTSFSNASTTGTSYPASQPQAQPQLSPESAAVVNHFGIDAPGILNQYATTLEDALIQQQSVLDEVASKAAAMEFILTDGEQLADYTNRYFTEVEPLDDEASDYDQASYEQQLYNQVAGGQAPGAAGYGQLPAVPATATTGGNYGAPDPQTQWSTFDQAMNQDPQNAWRYLSSMTPDAFRSKLLFLDQA